MCDHLTNNFTACGTTSNLIRSSDQNFSPVYNIMFRILHTKIVIFYPNYTIC